MRITIALLGLLTLAACAEPFDPYWRVEKFRVLAIQASPVTLKPFESSTLTPLYVTEDGAPVTFQWDWCPFQTQASNEYECPFTREELAEQLTSNIPEDMMLPPGFDLAALLPEFDLGTEETATFAYPLTVDAVRGICELTQGFIAQQDEMAAADLSVSNCDRGYEITIRMIAKSGDARIVAAKRVNLWTGRDEFVNLNPDVTDIELRLAKAEDAMKVADKMPWVADNGVGEWYRLPADEATPIVANIPLEIRSIVDPDSIEEFTPPAPMGSDREFKDPEREAVLYRWFTEAGFVDDSNKLYKEGVSPEGPADSSITVLNVSYLENPTEDELYFRLRNQDTDWDVDGVPNATDNCPMIPNAPFQDATECRMRLWSVVRDGRLGLDWVERELIVVDIDRP